MLVDLIIPRKDIIEENEYPEKINTIWKTIQETYNCQAITGYKSILDLQYMYNVYFKEAKSNKCKNKEEIYKTGCGQSSLTLTSVKQKVMCLLCNKINPLDNVFDSDTEYKTLTAESPVEEKNYKILTIEPVFDDTGLYNDVKLIEQSEEIINENYKEFHQFSPPHTSKQETNRNQNSHTEIHSTKITPGQHSSKKVYEGLNKLADQRLTVSSTKLNMEKQLYELKIKNKKKICLETAEIEKEIMNQKLISQNLEVSQNEIKEQILILELNNKRSK